MDPLQNDPQRNRPAFDECLDYLTNLGWIKSWGWKGDRYVVQWTPMGARRAMAVRQLDIDVKLDERQWSLLRAACSECGPRERFDFGP